MKAPLRYLIAVCALLAGGVAQALAQAYPAKPVRVILGITGGGPGDIAFRGASQVLQQALGQPFVVENRVGADGIIGGEACVRSAPDGYTLCGGDSYNFTLNPVIRAKMPYDPAKDMAPVVLLGYLPASIWVHASVPANTLGALFEMARSKPGSVSWGSFGLASASHLYIEYLKNAKNVVFLNVPYKAASQAWQALVAGEVQVAVYASRLAMPMAKAGKVKGLAINLDKRMPQMPDMPTFQEAGMDIPIVTWFGMTAPAGTPREIVLRVNAEVSKGLINHSTMREQILGKAGVEVQPPAGESPEAFAAMMQRERAKYAGLVKAAGVQVE